VGQELDPTPEQHRVRLASADDVPAVAALWQANVREAGETLDAGDQQAIQALLLADPQQVAIGIDQGEFAHAPGLVFQDRDAWNPLAAEAEGRGLAMQ
ncbi:hypothetical protein, partial [Pseudomonas aeruginosa]